MDDSHRYEIGLAIAFDEHPAEARLMLEQFGTAEAIFRESHLEQITGLRQSSLEKIQSGKALQRADEEIMTLEKKHIRAIYLDNPEYPFRLKSCQDAPIVLYSLGSSNLNAKKILSIVGTRKATSNGRHTAENLVHDLALMFPDLIIVSGLAYGIDISAQKSALENNLNTVAVLAHGMHEIYPAMHRKYALDIIKNGSLITELTYGTPSEKRQFLRRNRIVAGICDACIVVETAESGGSLNTARTAFGYGRDVFAFPGRPTDERSKGCNMIIKNLIAGLVESAEDIAKCMNWDIPKPGKTLQQCLFPDLTTLQQIIYDSMEAGEKYSSEEIGIKRNISIADALSNMMILEMADLVESLPGSLYTKRRIRVS